jgi:CBS domain-containing protein
MLVRDLMTAGPVTVGPAEPAATAARLMARCNVGALPVCGEDGRLCGMVTDRDILLRCVAAGRGAEQTAVGAIMTRRVAAVGPEDTADRAAALMAREQVRRLPVTKDGRVLGVVSLADLAEDLQAQALGAVSQTVRRL